MATMLDLDIQYGAPKCRYWRQTGTAYTSKPHLPLSPQGGELPWNWFPWKFRISTPALLYTLGALFCFIALSTGFVAGLTSRTTSGFSATTTSSRGPSAVVPAVLTILFLLLAIPCFYMAYMMTWNFRLREAICWAQGKAVQAKAQWKITTTPEQAKLVFFRRKISKNVEIHVLRDGSQELWNTSGGEFRAGLDQALGQAGFDGQIYSAGGFVTDSINDGAVAKPVDRVPDRPSPV